MKPNKNTIKIIKEFSILIDKLIELKKVSTPISERKQYDVSFVDGIEFSKRAMNSKPMSFSEIFDKVKKEDPVLKNAYEEINKTITEKCSCERFVDLEGYKSVLIKECDYCKNKKEDPVLKNAYEEIEGKLLLENKNPNLYTIIKKSIEKNKPIAILSFTGENETQYTTKLGRFYVLFSVPKCQCIFDEKVPAELLIKYMKDFC